MGQINVTAEPCISRCYRH